MNFDWKGDKEDTGQIAVTSILESHIAGNMKPCENRQCMDRGILSHFLQNVESRRAVWFESLEKIMHRYSVANGDSSMNDLLKREDVVSMMLLTSEIAMRNHRREKLTALQNLFESYLKTSVDDDTICRNFALQLDRFSIWHLRILSILGDPKRWAKTKGVELPEWSFGSASNLLEYAYTELDGAQDFYDPIAMDLHREGLLRTDNLHRIVPFIELFEPLATRMGTLFIEMTRLHESV